MFAYGVSTLVIFPLNLIALFGGFVLFFPISKKILSTYANIAITSKLEPIRVLEKDDFDESNGFLNNIEHLIKQIEDNNISSKLRELVDSAKRLQNVAFNKPILWPFIRRYLGYYLVSVINICDKYLNITDKKLKNIKALEINKTLDKVLLAYDKKEHDISVLDLSDLNIDIKVLEKNLH